MHQTNSNLTPRLSRLTVTVEEVTALLREVLLYQAAATIPKVSLQSLPTGMIGGEEWVTTNTSLHGWHLFTKNTPEGTEPSFILLPGEESFANSLEEMDYQVPMVTFPLEYLPPTATLETDERTLSRLYDLDALNNLASLLLS